MPGTNLLRRNILRFTGLSQKGRGSSWLPLPPCFLSPFPSSLGHHSTSNLLFLLPFFPNFLGRIARRRWGCLRLLLAGKFHVVYNKARQFITMNLYCTTFFFQPSPPFLVLEKNREGWSDVNVFCTYLTTYPTTSVLLKHRFRGGWSLRKEAQSFILL